MAREISSEDWILLALLNSSEKYGFDLDTWYFHKKPEKLKDNLTQFHNTLKRMKDSDIIKNATEFSENYCLTKEGKKKARDLKGKLKLANYYSLVSQFPEIEIKERIGRIESFLVSLTFLVLLYFIGINSRLSNDTLSLILLVLYGTMFLSSIIFLITTLTEIIIFWIINLNKNTLWIYREFLWNQRNKIVNLIQGLVVLGIIYAVYTFKIFTLEVISGTLALSIAAHIIINWKNISAKIKSLLRWN